MKLELESEPLSLTNHCKFQRSHPSLEINEDFSICICARIHKVRVILGTKVYLCTFSRDDQFFGTGDWDQDKGNHSALNVACQREERNSMKPLNITFKVIYLSMRATRGEDTRCRCKFKWRAQVLHVMIRNLIAVRLGRQYEDLSLIFQLGPQNKKSASRAIKSSRTLTKRMITWLDVTGGITACNEQCAWTSTGKVVNGMVQSHLWIASTHETSSSVVSIIRVKITKRDSHHWDDPMPALARVSPQIWETGLACSPIVAPEMK